MRPSHNIPGDLRLFFVAGIIFTALVGAADVSPVLAAEKINCDIQRGSCRQVADSGTAVELDILPKPVKALTELDFIVTIKRGGVPLKDALIDLDLTMPGMFMGHNRPVLKQVKPGRYEGKGVITRCPSGGKTWQAEVTIEHDGKTAIVDFLFEVT